MSLKNDLAVMEILLYYPWVILLMIRLICRVQDLAQACKTSFFIRTKKKMPLYIIWIIIVICRLYFVKNIDLKVCVISGMKLNIDYTWQNFQNHINFFCLIVLCEMRIIIYTLKIVKKCVTVMALLIATSKI